MGSDDYHLDQARKHLDEMGSVFEEAGVDELTEDQNFLLNEHRNDATAHALVSIAGSLAELAERAADFRE